MFYRILLVLLMMISFVEMSVSQKIMKDYGLSEKQLQELEQVILSKECPDRIKKSKEKKYYKNSQKNIFNEIKSLNEEGYLIYNGTFNTYLKSIFQEIVLNNSAQLSRQKYWFFISRSSICNAYSYGNGVVVISLGLVRRFFSEDQVAFVLAHELTHDVKNHSEISIIRNAKLANNRSINSQLKKASQLDYMNRTAVESILLKLIAFKNKKKQQYELFSDLNGIHLLENTKYNSSASLEVINVLDSVDYLFFEDSLAYDKLLSNSFVRFKKEWKEFENESFWKKSNFEREIPDSIKTHPDCSIRALKLESHLKKNDQSFIELDSSFLFQANHEILMQYLEIGAYDMALFEGLHQKTLGDDSAYLNCIVTHTLYLLADARKKGQFSLFVSHAKPKYPNGYNYHLNVLNGLSSSKLFDLYEGYHNTYVRRLKKDEYSDFLNLLLKWHKGDITFSSKAYQDFINTTKVELFKQTLN